MQWIKFINQINGIESLEINEIKRQINWDPSATIDQP